MLENVAFDISDTTPVGIPLVGSFLSSEIMY